jgi:two-component sensor histidine kinase
MSTGGSEKVEVGTAVSLSVRNARLVAMLKQAGLEREAEKLSAAIQGALTEEIHHRTKNLLTAVTAIVRQTLRSAATLADAEKSISARLLAMSKAHDALLRAGV